jgi:hypothetical protein
LRSAPCCCFWLSGRPLTPPRPQIILLLVTSSLLFASEAEDGHASGLSVVKLRAASLGADEGVYTHAHIAGRLDDLVEKEAWQARSRRARALAHRRPWGHAAQRRAGPAL